MASEGNGQNVLYQVVTAKQNLAWLKELHHQLDLAEKGKGFLHSLREIYRNLRTRPVEFGEPQFRLPALELMVYQASINPLVVHYAIHEKRPLVIIQNFKSF